LASDRGDAEVCEATAGRDAGPRIGAGQWKLATDNSLTLFILNMLSAAWGVLRVVLN
jgi:hypothetical protein